MVNIIVRGMHGRRVGFMAWDNDCAAMGWQCLCMPAGCIRNNEVESVMVKVCGAGASVLRQSLGRVIAVAVIAVSLLGSEGLSRSHVAQADDKEPVVIGEINSYSRIPAFTEPYRNGWKLAVAQINASGGVLGGRPLKVIDKDDGGRPGAAINAARELIERDQVHVLAGTFLSNVGLAVSDVAKRKRVVFVAAEPLTDALVWTKGNRYTFRLRPSTYMQVAMLAQEAAKLPAKRWVTIAPNYEYGQAAVAVFQKLLKSQRPDVEFVGGQWPPLFKLDAGSSVQALLSAQPDAVFNVLFSADLAKFVREGKARGLFDGRPVVSLLTGEPEYLQPLGAETPEGWIVTGYPVLQIDSLAHKKFVKDYTAEFGEAPKMGSLVGYNTFLSIAAALNKAGSTDSEDLVKAFRGLWVQTPIGSITFRSADHQSTMGAWIGTTTVQDGKGVMANWRYVSGAEVLPPEDKALQLRPAE
jgi:branched-chain amino acid transport system substrate-binding protein